MAYTATAPLGPYNANNGSLVTSPVKNTQYWFKTTAAGSSAYLAVKFLATKDSLTVIDCGTIRAPNQSTTSSQTVWFSYTFTTDGTYQMQAKAYYYYNEAALNGMSVYGTSFKIGGSISVTYSVDTADGVYEDNTLNATTKASSKPKRDPSKPYYFKMVGYCSDTNAAMKCKYTFDGESEVTVATPTTKVGTASTFVVSKAFDSAASRTLGWKMYEVDTLRATAGTFSFTITDSIVDPPVSGGGGSPKYQIILGDGINNIPSDINNTYVQGQIHVPTAFKISDIAVFGDYGVSGTINLTIKKESLDNLIVNGARTWNVVANPIVTNTYGIKTCSISTPDIAAGSVLIITTSGATCTFKRVTVSIYGTAV